VTAGVADDRPLAYVASPHRCSDCGDADLTVVIATECGDTLCSACWSETTATSETTTPELDRVLARARARRLRRRTRR